MGHGQAIGYPFGNLSASIYCRVGSSHVGRWAPGKDYRVTLITTLDYLINCSVMYKHPKLLVVLSDCCKLGRERLESFTHNYVINFTRKLGHRQEYVRLFVLEFVYFCISCMTFAMNSFTRVNSKECSSYSSWQ